MLPISIAMSKLWKDPNILDNLRKGNFDVLIGVNLLREGLDLPEVTLVRNS